MRTAEHKAPRYVVFSTPLSHPNILLSTLLSKTLSLRSSLSVRDQVSQFAVRLYPLSFTLPHTYSSFISLSSRQSSEPFYRGAGIKGMRTQRLETLHLWKFQQRIAKKNNDQKVSTLIESGAT